ncbi:MAG: hypothetical protein OXE99_11765, partial [Cellvibrionales bacterium]|nr:hypothetical protein [Cellvibrionales bacterium]
MKQGHPSNSQSSYGLLLLILLFALGLHSSGLIHGRFYADDYVHAAMFTGDSELKKLGVLEGIDAKSIQSLTLNQFNFFDPSQPNYQALRNYSMLPWWTDDSAKIHFFRPLATFTHWLDYQWFPKNAYWMQGVNLCWYLLSLLAAFCFFRQFGLTHGQSLFALLLVALDLSSNHTVSWIAARNSLMVIALGLFSLIAFNRSREHSPWYMLSLVLFCATLLSAEASITICLFFAAFTLSVDSRSLTERALAILPFAIIALGWQIVYSMLGFGASHIDFYQDPTALLSHPIDLFSQLIKQLPQRFFELVTGLEALTLQLNPNDLWIIQIAGSGFLVIFIWLALHYKANRPIRFFALATLFGLLPSLLSASPMRGLLLPFISFAAFLTLIASHNRRSALQKISTYTALFFAVAVALMINGWLFISQLQTKATPSSSLLPPISADKHLVVINANKLFPLIYWPFKQRFYEQPLPKSFHILGTNIYDTEITRISKDQFRLTKTPYFH